MFWAIVLNTTNPKSGMYTYIGKKKGSFQIIPQYISLRTVLCENALKKKNSFFASVKGGGDYLLNTGFPM